MPKKDFCAALKQRTKQSLASERTDIEEVYSNIFGEHEQAHAIIKLVPTNKLRHFYTTNIGFHTYTPEELQDLAKDIQENGLLEKGIARPIRGTDEYEVLSGNSRLDACILLGWQAVPFEIEDCDDNRAIVIATVTNLKRRQNLLPSERGFAYRALLDAQKRQGKRTDMDSTCAQSEHKIKTRDKIAAHFGVDRNTIQREIRLTFLIQPLLEAVDNHRLNLMCGVQLSYYDDVSQALLFEHIQNSDVKLTVSRMKQIKAACPPPSLTKAVLDRAWNKLAATSKIEKSKEIVFKRKLFAPYLDKLGNDQLLEELFLKFLKEQCQNRGA